MRITDTTAKPSGGNVSVAKAWVRALEMTAPIAARSDRVLPAVIEELSARFKDAPALLSDGESLTFRTLASRMNQYGRWALAKGLAKGDTVCLFMPNCPEYMAAWLGIIHAGGVVSLLNTNLEGRSLAHCIDLVAPTHIIVAAELLDSFLSATPYLMRRAKTWLHGAGPSELPRIDLEVARHSGSQLDADVRRQLTTEDRALYIYTSGTTGLPKAVNVNHYRLMVWSHWFAGLLDTKPGDRMYNCLPMYHSIGGTVAPGAALVNGGAVVLRKKFSQSHFWDDVTRWECTLVQYIGEMCRYLLHSPFHPLERAHKIRLFCGNGLRPDVWQAFKDRFAIPQILEFYAATEGTFSLFNIEAQPGAIGRIPSFLAHRFPTALIKFDIETGEPQRNAEGYCVRCAPNEAGEALGRIVKDAASLGGRFEGYTNNADSEKKILRNVFAAGDAWYRTGDLMRKDEKGFWYFVDRIGDTFRWKGENVSTREVAEAISLFHGVKEAVVYGVTVPGTEGRAGMVALVADPRIDLHQLRLHIAEQLPPYAQPLFLRICERIEMTATFKQRKMELIRDGFDPRAPGGVYFNDPGQRAYVRLDGALFDRIVNGKVRL